jgi:hypothetical protein
LGGAAEEEKAMIELPDMILRSRMGPHSPDCSAVLALRGGADSWFVKQLPPGLYDKTVADFMEKWKRLYSGRLRENPDYPLPEVNFSLEEIKGSSNACHFEADFDGLFTLFRFSCMRFPGQCAGFLVCNPCFGHEHQGWLKAVQPIWEAIAIADGYSTFVASSNEYIHKSFFEKRGFVMGHKVHNRRSEKDVYWWFKDLPTVAEYQQAWRKEQDGKQKAVEGR